MVYASQTRPRTVVLAIIWSAAIDRRFFLRSKTAYIRGTRWAAVSKAAINPRMPKALGEWGATFPALDIWLFTGSNKGRAVRAGSAGQQGTRFSV
jgi:hypothetical protein